MVVNSRGEVASSVIIGTPGYMPNEQNLGKACLASDVYALGMTAIAALTGVKPIELEENPDTGEVVWLQKAQASAELGEVISKMVRRHFSLRYSCATDLLEELSITPSQLQQQSSASTTSYSTISVTNLLKTTRTSFPIVNYCKRRKVLQIMGNHFSSLKSGKHPAESLSWNNANECCQRLAEKTGREYRLPSEAEWEYACRAQTTTPFHFGETITTKLVNYDGNYTYADAPKGEFRNETTEVGSFPPNAFGLYDMHGNIREWSQDTWQENYKNAPSDGSAWIEDNNNTHRVLRGGSWSNLPAYCRSAFRYYDDPNYGYEDFGMRVVCSI